jgi:hypothetical protein
MSAVRKIQFRRISDAAILTSYRRCMYQDAHHGGPVKVSKGYENTLQVYTSIQLQDVFREHGFSILNQTGMNGETFSPEHTQRILTIAQSI